jgi:AAA domain-containing protein
MVLLPIPSRVWPNPSCMFHEPASMRDDQLTYFRAGVIQRTIMPRARILSFINYKGGVAKTTTTYHVGCSLAQHFNKKVLLVDIDPQTNLTFLCAPVDKWQDFKRRTGTIKTMYQRYMRASPEAKRRQVQNRLVRKFK